MFEIIKEHWANREQLFRMAKTDLIKTYRASVLGWSWAIIKPSITILVYWFAFTYGLRAGNPVNGYPYFLWLIAGLIPWFYISGMLTQGSEVTKRYSYLITKMRFPVSMISTFMSLSKLYVNLVLSVILIVVYFLCGGTLDVYLIQLPFCMAFMFLFFTLWSMLTVPLTAISGDFANILKSVVQPLFWLSGIMWSTDSLDPGLLRSFLELNPITFLAHGYRDSLVYKQWIWSDPQSFFGFIIIFILIGVLAVRTHNRLKKEIPDVL